MPRLVGLLTVAVFTALVATVSAKEPHLTVAPPRLVEALTCYGDLSDQRSPPILVVPGTGFDGSHVYALGKGAFDAIGRPVCTLSLPDRATADLQISVQYVVHAIRTLSRRAVLRIAVAGIRQGGLLVWVALTYWPSLRRRVADVVTAATPHRGAQAPPEGTGRCFAEGCPPAIWQQAAGSSFMRTLNSGRDETPGRTAYTTVRSATDEVMRPQRRPRR